MKVDEPARAAVKVIVVVERNVRSDGRPSAVGQVEHDVVGVDVQQVRADAGVIAGQIGDGQVRRS